MWWLFQTGDTLLDRVPEEVTQRAQEIADQVKANPTLAAILLGVAVLTALIFFWGIVKNMIKAVIFGGVASVAAWIWYFNVR